MHRKIVDVIFDHFPDPARDKILLADLSERRENQGMMCQDEPGMIPHRPLNACIGHIKTDEDRIDLRFRIADQKSAIIPAAGKFARKIQVKFFNNPAKLHLSPPKVH